MTRPAGNHVLEAALKYASRGWPVFPCSPGRKAPATAHGYLDATTDPDQLRDWFAQRPARNLAIATGAPGPDVLDADQHGQAGNGFAALNQLHRQGLLSQSAAVVRTPGGEYTDSASSCLLRPRLAINTPLS
ncbi:MAG TPA: bifunctional DNA primase/polymerase [Streptosporangiaceae bacterium]|nr:bifunctional DNA primase/polymerase [Streptosporangiaceae bacterium]